MSTKLSESAQRKKGIFLLCVPVLIIPILALLAWNGPANLPLTEPETHGLNLEIPSPSLEKKQSSKADAYQSVQTAEKAAEEWPLPDFLNQSLLESSAKVALPNNSMGFDLISHQTSEKLLNPSLNGTEKEIQERLLLLDQVVQGREIPASFSSPLQRDAHNSREIDPQLLELQQMMDQIMASKKQPDPEIQQLEGLMDKILQLQYPDKYPSPELKIVSDFSPVSVGSSAGNSNQEEITFPEIDDYQISSNGFFGLDEKTSHPYSDNTSFPKTIAASVARSQEIIPGEALELTLEQDLTVGGNVISPGSVLHAKTSLKGSRLEIQVSGILQEGILIPVSLIGYGLDGISGIELSDMKGASQWIKASSQSAQSMNMGMLGMDWQSQLANSGIQATRNLIRSKSRVRKIEIKAGHPILLIDSSTSKTQSL